ncbi:MAG: hypothetical protein ABI321_10565 [Polyangia bacterium]
MGKPSIHSVEDAIAVFCTTGLDVLVDVLVIEDAVLIRKQSSEQSSTRNHSIDT